jgi:uncharacterized OB-fold protein
MNARVPYAVAMIELDEGVRLMANIVDSVLEQIEIGCRVCVTFEALTEHICLAKLSPDLFAKELVCAVR